MKKKLVVITKQPEETETVNQEDLRKLSQCIKNIKKIIEAHCTDPIEESKDLDHTYYSPEREKLHGLLRTPTGIMTVPDQETLLASLTDDLILNRAKTERAKKQIDHADDCLSIAMGKVQRARKYGETRPTTGLEEGELKDFLDGFIAKKQIGGNGAKIKAIEEVKKYDEVKEDILLETLGMKIKGNKIIKGTKNKQINSTDKNLIYYFYEKSIINKDECFSTADLSETKEINKSKRYIQNRITEVNNAVKGILSEGTNSKIKLIVKEKDRQGYHLNPKLFTKNIEK